MYTEEAKQSRIKKFFKITLGVLAVIFVLMGIAYFLTVLKNAKQAGTSASVKKEYTQEEKLQMLHDLANAMPKDSATTTAEKLRLLHNFAKKMPQDSPAEQARKLELLHALASSTKQ